LPGISGDEVAKSLPSNLPRFLLTGEISVDLKTAFEGIFQKPMDVEKIQGFLKEKIAEKMK
jgi:hypothetical protein